MTGPSSTLEGVPTSADSGDRWAHWRLEDRLGNSCSGRRSQFQWLTARLLVGAIISVRLKEDEQTELRQRLARVSGKGGGDLANA